MPYVGKRPVTRRWRLQQIHNPPTFFGNLDKGAHKSTGFSAITTCTTTKRLNSPDVPSHPEGTQCTTQTGEAKPICNESFVSIKNPSHINFFNFHINLVFHSSNCNSILIFKPPHTPPPPATAYAADPKPELQTKNRSSSTFTKRSKVAPKSVQNGSNMVLIF